MAHSDYEYTHSSHWTSGHPLFFLLCFSDLLWNCHFLHNDIVTFPHIFVKDFSPWGKSTFSTCSCSSHLHGLCRASFAKLSIGYSFSNKKECCMPLKCNSTKIIFTVAHKWKLYIHFLVTQTQMITENYMDYNTGQCLKCIPS